MTPPRHIRRFLASGDHDMLYGGWPGTDMLEKAHKAENAMKQALVAEVLRRSKGRHHASLPPDFNPGRFVLDKVGPMVRGFFPANEQQIVLGLFTDSLKFVTRDNFKQLLDGMNWLGSAWQVAISLD